MFGFGGENFVSESLIKKQLFKSARTDKVDLFQSTIAKVPDLSDAFSYLQKKDPEGRSVVDLCLLFSSVNVLRAIYQHFNSEFDVSSFIMRAQFDHNHSFAMAAGLA